MASSQSSSAQADTFVGRILQRIVNIRPAEARALFWFSNPLDDLKAAQRLVAGASGAQANLIIMGRSAGDAFEAKYQREGSLQQAFHHTRLARSQDAKRSWRIQRVYGILLDANVDTAQAFSDSSVTGSIARAGSFKGPKLIVGVGTNVSTLTDALRKNGIYVEGAIVAPLAAAMPSEAETPAPAETEATPTA